MTARSIRRAAERQAAKLARKAEKTAVHSVAIQLDSEPEASATDTVSPAQLQANRANAQLSTGPTSLDGKATSCLNAVKTGLTGRTVLLHTDDAADYQRHIAAYEKELSPVGPRECDLVQSIADTAWRLGRIPGLEMAIYARGHVQFADKFKDHDEALRPGLIELETFLTYEKQLRNLQLQEARLARRMAKDAAELRELQHARRKKELEAQKDVLVRAASCKWLRIFNRRKWSFVSTAFPRQPVSQPRNVAETSRLRRSILTSSVIDFFRQTVLHFHR